MGAPEEIWQPECIIRGEGGERYGVSLEIAPCPLVEGNLQWPG